MNNDDEFVENVANFSGEETTPRPQALPEDSMGKPNRHSIRSRNSFVCTGVGHDSRSRYHLDRREEEDGEESEEEDGGIASPEKKSCCTSFCGFMDDHFLAFVIGSAAIGMGIGIGLSFWNPQNYADKATAILWIGLLGDLFIRALKCIVLPLIFLSIAISVMDMLALGQAGSVSGITIGLYICTTICAAIIGCVVSVLFSNLYTLQEDGVGEGLDANVKIGCDVDEYGNPQSFLTQQADGSVVCEANGGSGNTTIFSIEDVNGYFQKSPQAEGPAKLSLSEGLYQGLFMQLIGGNMFKLFTEGNFLGVIVLGAGFGVALVQLSNEMPPDVNWDMILTIQVLEEVMQVFMKFITWIIKCTPFAIISLIAAAIGAQTNIGEIFAQLGVLFAAVCVGLLMQFFLVYCGFYLGFVRKNPFKYYKHTVPAMMVSFATSSSAASIPVSIDCAVSSGDVPIGVARFVIPLGATINMDGSAIYIICGSVWMAYQNGIIPGAGDYILLVLAATVGSMGAAPVPSATIIMMLVAYTTAFGSPSGGSVPAGLGYIFAFDWLLDRLITMFNILGDLAVTGIIANKVNKDVANIVTDVDDALLEGRERSA